MLTGHYADADDNDDDYDYDYDYDYEQLAQGLSRQQEEPELQTSDISRRQL